MKRITFLFLLLTQAAFAQVRFARIFSDHVVLQRQQPIPVWGWAKPGERVTVALAGQNLTAKADAGGKWLVRFAALEAGGPHQLTASAKSGKAQLADVLIGDVWLCSGQSNMEWPVRQANNFSQEKKGANFPQIRHFLVEHTLSLTPDADLKSGEWQVCSPETVGGFTAVGYFFAREVSQKLGVPIGLLHSSWGGSQAEGWISREGMLSNDELRPVAQRLPTTWAGVDSLMDAKLQRQFIGKGTLNPTPADERKYLDPGYEFTTWRKADPFGQWDWKGGSGFRGKGYMAKVVEIPEELAGQATTLALAEHDGPTEIFVNGQKIAEGAWKGVRKISVPANAWKPGANRLVVKFGNALNPAWYGLGLMGSPADLYVEGGGQRVSLAGEWHLMPAFAEPHSYTRFVNNHATGLYNGMIAPVLPFAIRGALWYQGETNAGRAYQYRQTFPLLITDWRRLWSREFPFYFVQLSSFGGSQDSNTGSGWAELREAQTMTLSLPNTGMAVTTDVGNPKDIHPTNKQDVGRRLAVVALRQEYGQADAPAGSPLYEAATFADGKAVISFKNAPKDLTVKDKYGYLKGFEIAGDDRVFRYAQAEIRGTTVVVSHPAVAKPVAVRYGWTDAPEDANLFSADGFPVSPFRTDAWPGVTAKARFE